MTVIDRTQCPQCNTVYRIGFDQLNLAGGQVRCGACLHIFDAPLHGWSTEARMHATEASPLDPLAETDPVELPNMPSEVDEEALRPEPSAPSTAPRSLRSPRFEAIRIYGRWWLLGAALGTLALALLWWLRSAI